MTKHFEGIVFGGVERFELPNLWALNFLLHGSLGGWRDSIIEERCPGKTLSSAMLRMELEIEETVRL